MNAISRPDDQLVEALILQLRCADKDPFRSMLNDPRDPKAQQPPGSLDIYAREAVRRSIATVRRRDQLEIPLKMLINRLKSVLRLGGDLLTSSELAMIQEAHDRLDTYRLEPPGKIGSLKDSSLRYKCAKEFAYLMDMFALAGPTETKGGPFHKGAAILYEACTGERGANMRNACKAVLDERKGKTVGKDFRQMHDPPTVPPILRTSPSKIDNNRD